MRITRAISNLIFIAIAAMVLTIPTIAQDPQDASQPQPARVAPGRKLKLQGVILSREADKLVIRDINGLDLVVSMSGATRIYEKKSNPFRSARTYPTAALLRGLEVEIEGRGNNSGEMVAEKIRFTNDDFGVARSIESRVTPVETRVTSTETRMDSAENRLTAAEQNAQRLSGQLEELAAVANTARGGAKAAQETADQALAIAKTATADIQATNDRISQIDNYETSKNVTVNFRVNSAVLSDEAKAVLDEIALQAKGEKGYLIQVTGYASADGPESRNRILSERRAEAVRRYLAETHDIPLHRMINPFGYGELKPIADNSTRDGRKQNRRVEVAILVNKGLTASGGSSAQSSQN